LLGRRRRVWAGGGGSAPEGQAALGCCVCFPGAAPRGRRPRAGLGPGMATSPESRRPAAPLRRPPNHSPAHPLSPGCSTFRRAQTPPLPPTPLCTPPPRTSLASRSRSWTRTASGAQGRPGGRRGRPGRGSRRGVPRPGACRPAARPSQIPPPPAPVPPPTRRLRPPLHQRRRRLRGRRAAQRGAGDGGLRGTWTPSRTC
jgi:hypothetical protein